MKKVLSFSPAVLCVLYAVIPLCGMIGRLCGTPFTPCGDWFWTPAVTAISLVLTVLLCLYKPPGGKIHVLFAAFLGPLSVINGLYSLVLSDWQWTPVFVFVCCACSLALVILRVRPAALKAVIAALSGLASLSLLFIAFFLMLFRGFGTETVIRSVPSPRGAYTAEVVDDDQGALGGNTLVRVKENGGIDLGIGRFAKPPVTLYTGKWGEGDALTVSWQGEDTLVIQGVEYVVRF